MIGMRRLGTLIALLALSAVPILIPSASTVAFAAAGDTQCAPGTIAYSPDTPAALGLLQNTAAWTHSTGAGVIVAIVDSGIDAHNAHLKDAVIGGINLVGDGTDSSGLSDLDGHGTAIAGLVAARSVPGSGVIGLAPDAKLLSVRVFRGTNEENIKAGFGPTIERLAQGIRYATDHGATIINVSLSDYTDSGPLLAAVNYATANGSLIVASAGNRATTTNKTDGPRYPAAYPGVLGVAATGLDGIVTNDSIHGPHVAISAPGSEILTSATGSGDCLYASDAPTSSFATGYVSAAAALVASAHPDETPAHWAYRLQATALRTDRDHRNDEAGWGAVQPADAITLAPGASTRGPEGPFSDTSTSAVRPAHITVAPDYSVSPFDVAQSSMVLLVAIAATLLGTLGLVIALRARRRSSGVGTGDVGTAGVGNDGAGIDGVGTGDVGTGDVGRSIAGGRGNGRSGMAGGRSTGGSGNRSGTAGGSGNGSGTAGGSSIGSIGSIAT